jgi:hypothetical protein
MKTISRVSIVVLGLLYCDWWACRACYLYNGLQMLHVHPLQVHVLGSVHACMHGQAAAVHPMSRKCTRRATITEPDAQRVQNPETMVIDARMIVMREIMVIMGGSFSMLGTGLQ